MNQQQQNGVGIDETESTVSVVIETGEIAMQGRGMKAILFNAAKEGNIKTIRQNITPGQVQTTPTGKTILHIAAEFDSYECVKEILQLDPDLLFHADRRGDTALHVAARSGHSKAAEALIEAAKSPRRGPNTESGNHTVVEEFIGKTNNKQNTALHEAVDVKRPSESVVRLLVEEYPEHEYLPNKRGETPLFVAAERGHEDSALAILQGNSSAQHNGPLGRTTLHAAVMSDLQGLTQELLERRPDLAKQADGDGWTPLHWAAYYDHYNRVKQLLVHDPTLAYIVDKDGLTSLHVASINNSTSAMRGIISLCPDCYDMVDHKGRNALHHAAMHNQKGSMGFLRRSLFRSLYSEGDKEGNTAFHLLAASNVLFMHLLLPVSGVDWKSLNNNNESVGSLQCGAPQMPNIMPKKVLERLYRRPRVPNLEMEGKKEVENNEERSRGVGSPSSYLSNELVVTALIATVSFAAGFTLPGGYNGAGKAILGSDVNFQGFLLFDTLAFVCSTVAVFILSYMPTFISKTTGNGIKNGEAIRRAKLLNLLEWACYPFTLCAITSMFFAFLFGVSAAMQPSAFTTPVRVTLCFSGITLTYFLPSVTDLALFRLNFLVFFKKSTT